MTVEFNPWPSFSKEEAQIASDVLLSNKVNYWTGENGKLFEQEFAKFTNVDYAVALSNGTTALEAALYSLGVGPGDEVVVSPRTFIASVSSIVRVGATPIFADVDLDSQNITLATIKNVVSKKTKAILLVHLAGWPCDLDEIVGFARQQSLYVIEDCAQAHGAKYHGKPVGSFGDISAWSFCQDKIMTTAGEGGMITTNSRELWSKVWSLKDHGKSYEKVFHTLHSPGFRWLHDSFGSNFRMTEIQAAIGRYQLGKMQSWHSRRLAHANQIWSFCSELSGLRVPIIPSDIVHAAYKCYVFVEPRKLKSGWSRDRVISEINSMGVPCFTGSCAEVYLEKAFDNTSLRPDQKLVNAAELGQTGLMFLVHPTLTEASIDYLCDVVKIVMEQAT